MCVCGGGGSPFPSPPSSAQGGVQLLVKDLPLIALLATSRVVPELEYRWTQKLRFCLLRIPNCERVSPQSLEQVKSIVLHASPTAEKSEF